MCHACVCDLTDFIYDQIVYTWRYNIDSMMYIWDIFVTDTKPSQHSENKDLQLDTENEVNIVVNLVSPCMNYEPVM